MTNWNDFPPTVDDLTTMDLVDLDTEQTITITLDENNLATPVDMVNAPPHYILKPGLEVKDVREALLQKLQRDGIVLPYEDAYDWMTAWEYMTRAPFKNGLEDYEKAMWYLESLINRMIERGNYEYQPED
jgi:hypothetical protein